MAIAHTLTTTAVNAGTAALTISSHVVSGTDPTLVVKIAYKHNSGGNVTGVTWNGGAEALTQLGTESRNGNANSQIWYLAAPTATTADVVISFTDSVRCVGAASNYTDVDQTNPFRTAANATNNGTNASPTVDVVALNNEMVVDSLSQVSAGPDTAAGDHTERHDTAATGGGTDTRGASQEKASTGATETMGWTMGDADNWGTSAGALQQPQGTVVSDTRDARTDGQATTSDTRDARTQGQITTSDTRDARTEGEATVTNTRDARTEGLSSGTVVSDTRSARTAGTEVVTNTRSARTQGQITTSDTRDARTRGQITTSDTRDARTEGLPVPAYTTFGMPFLYTSANWATGSSFYFEAYIRQTTGEAFARLYDNTAASAVTNGEVSTTSSSFTRLRTAALTLVNGNEYVVQFGTDPAHAGETLGGRIIVTG